ncbi:MAG: hypothetical protein PHC49_19890 [Desulfuromonadaceae bacterium]|nr:hypothetical protein [Desulfuromonadaceae bacterium]
MRTVLLLVSILFTLSGCAAVPVLNNTSTANLPPVMALEELRQQPYHKVGRILVTRKVYAADYAVAPTLQEWGLDALRLEAYKMDADAVILPEISSKESNIFIFPVFPATEYRAAGVAIKFLR